MPDALRALVCDYNLDVRTLVGYNAAGGTPNIASSYAADVFHHHGRSLSKATQNLGATNFAGDPEFTASRSRRAHDCDSEVFDVAVIRNLRSDSKTLRLPHRYYFFQSGDPRLEKRQHNVSGGKISP